MAGAAGQGVDCDILLSHTHWDHIQGLPFFAPLNDPLSRIRIHGFATADQALADTLRPLMQSPWFPIDWHQLPSRVEVHQLQAPDFQLGETQVRSSWLNHPGICAGFRLDTASGSVAYLPDHEPFHRYVSSLCANPDNAAARVSLAGEQDMRLQRFIAGSDLLIVDAQYDSREYPEFAGWGHGCSTDAVRMAVEAGVKKLCLFHHDPCHNDEDLDRMTAEAQGLARAAGSDLVVECAREGLEIVLQ
jgi:phosphoribosyl 1,2-cyclic phosphodiesterase